MPEVPETNTTDEQRVHMQAGIDELAGELVKKVNIQAIAHYKLTLARQDRQASAANVSDAAKAYRNTERDTNNMIDQMIQAYISFFEWLDQNG